MQGKKRTGELRRRVSRSAIKALDMVVGSRFNSVSELV